MKVCIGQRLHRLGLDYIFQWQNGTFQFLFSQCSPQISTKGCFWRTGMKGRVVRLVRCPLIEGKLTTILAAVANAPLVSRQEHCPNEGQQLFPSCNDIGFAMTQVHCHHAGLMLHPSSWYDASTSKTDQK